MESDSSGGGEGMEEMWDHFAGESADGGSSER